MKKVPSSSSKSAEFFKGKCRVILFNIWDGMKKGVLYKNAFIGLINSLIRIAY